MARACMEVKGTVLRFLAMKRAAKTFLKRLSKDKPVSDEESVSIEARLCVWRIFGIGHDFTDKKLPWSTSADAGPSAGDSLSIVFGDVPDHILDALRTWRGQIPYALDFIYGGQYASMPIEDKVAIIEGHVADVDLSDVTGTFPLFMTFELSRPIQIQADPAAKFFWVREGGPDVETLEGFGRTASQYLETAVPCVLAQLNDQLRPDRLTFGDDRAYLVAPGKAAVTVPRSTGSAYLTLRSSGWSSLPFTEITSAVQTLPTAFPIVSPIIATPSRWFHAALAVDSQDPLRRFLFAFFGLEVLVNKAEKTWRLRDRVGQELSNELGGLPADVLMWPVLRDDEAPFRNLVFRFACLAISLSRNTAEQDVAEFRKLVKVRNDLAHGEPTILDSLPAWPSIDLLRRYLSLVARAATPT
jgi:hypothetical protein